MSQQKPNPPLEPVAPQASPGLRGDAYRWNTDRLAPPSAAAPADSLTPQDRGRALSQLTGEFRDSSDFTAEEPSTALTEPPHGRSTPAQDGFLTQPIDRPVLLRLDGVQAGE